MAVERIIGNIDTGKVALEKTDRNMVLLEGSINADVAALVAHKAESVSELLYASRDISLVGSQIVSGFSKIPKRIDVLSIVLFTKMFSIGNKSNNAQQAITILEDGNTQGDAGAVLLGVNGSNYTRGSITINSDKTITINWSKEGTGGVGTAQLRIIAHYHGGE